MVPPAIPKSADVFLPQTAVISDFTKEPSFGSGRRILVVEDDRDSAEVLRTYLELKGHDVMVGSTGRDCVDSVTKFAPEIVICDLRLPGRLNGFDAARMIRHDPTNSKIVLIAISGSAEPEDQRLALDAGFDAFFPKPADFDALTTFIVDPYCGSRNDDMSIP